MDDQTDNVFATRFREDQIHRLGVAVRSGVVTSGDVLRWMRSSPDDLRRAGLTVAVHNDYQLAGEPHTFWLLTGPVGTDKGGKPIIRAFKGEGKTDEAALDQIRAAFAEAADNLHHAPLCPANHYHGTRAPTGLCSCGAVAEKARPR